MTIFSKLPTDTLLEILSYFPNTNNPELLNNLSFLYELFFCIENITSKLRELMIRDMLRTHPIIFFEKIIETECRSADFFRDSLLYEIVSLKRIDVMRLLHDKYSVNFDKTDKIDVLGEAVYNGSLCILKWFIDMKNTKNEYIIDLDDMKDYIEYAIMNHDAEMLIYFAKHEQFKNTVSLSLTDIKYFCRMLEYSIYFSSVNVLKWLLKSLQNNTNTRKKISFHIDIRKVKGNYYTKHIGPPISKEMVDFLKMHFSDNNDNIDFKIDVYSEET